MSHQTLDSGEPPAARFTRIASPRLEAPTNPLHTVQIISGFPGAGKTSLFLSCPDAFILNLDRKEVPRTATYAAGVWPTKREDGSLIGVNGQPFQMDWSHVQATIDLLCEMAESGDPRPSIVVFDTIAAAIDMIQRWMMTQARVSSWDQLGDGRRSWDRCYTLFTDAIVKLQSRGYGVAILCHLVNKTIQQGDSQKIITKTTISDGLWQRISYRADLSLAVVAETKPVTEQVVETVAGRERRRTLTQNKEVRILTADRPYLSGITRTFLSMPDVELSDDNGWFDFQTAYEAAISSQES